MSNILPKTAIIGGMLAALSMVVYLGGFVLNQAAFAAPNDNANPVAFGANTNQGYMENCKETRTARECATGPGNNGEFTSNLAHSVNGPP